MNPDDDKGFFDRPETVTRIIQVLLAVSALSVVADFFYHKHVDYDFQGWIGFDAIYGFIACVALVLSAKQLRRILMRDEDYYD